MTEQERFFCEQGREQSAHALAKAERWAKELRVYYSWRTERTEYRDEKGEWHVASTSVCRAYKLDEKYPFATVSGIIESNDPTERSNYRRVVEAELALRPITERRALALKAAMDTFAATTMSGLTARAKDNAKSVPQRAHELIAKWRAQAEKISTNKRDGKTAAKWLLTCANELESIVRDVGFVTQV